MKRIILLSSLLFLTCLLEARQDQRIVISGAEASYVDEGETISAGVARQLGIGREISYSPEMAFDNNEKTTWSAGSGKDGHGQWIKFDFHTISSLSKISIKNGYWVNDYNWKANWRARKLTLTTSEGEEYKLTLRDAKELQEFDLKNIKASWVKLTVKSSYQGKRGDWDICLSEVAFSGSSLEDDATIQSFVTALKGSDIKATRKSYKALKKKFEAPGTIKIKGLSLLDLSIKAGNTEFTKLLMKGGHDQVSVMGANGSSASPVALAQKVKELRQEYEVLMAQLKDSNYVPVRTELAKQQSQFKNAHTYLFDEEIKALDQLVKRRRKEALYAEFEIKKSELNNITFGFENHVSLGIFWSSFEAAYGSEAYDPAYQEVEDAYQAKRAEFIKMHMPRLRQMVDEAVDSERLSQLERIYIKDAYRSTDVLDFQAAITSRKNYLRDEAIARRKRAEEERKRVIREKEEARILAEQRAMAKFGFNFKTTGLKNEALFKAFFKGNFTEVPFNRDDMMFSGLLNGYMYAYANRCAAALPANRVQIQEMVCKTERVTRNGWGVETNRYCVAWKEVPTGLYATRELYAAHVEIYNMMNRDQLKNAGKLLMMMVEGNGMQPMANLAMDAKRLKDEVTSLVRINGCNSNAVKRFEENLIRFAHGRSPVKLEGSTAAEGADYSKSQNIKELVKDLVYENSKSWTFKYISGSLKNVRFVSSDGEGRPEKVKANYQFEGLLGIQQDEVEITFVEGMPDCIYFRNYSSDCRTPDRKVIAAFVSGKYVIR